MESVPFNTICAFTLFQLIYLLIVFGMTWIPVAGILFPLLFFFLIVIRQHLIPKYFDLSHLRELDAAEYEELEGFTPDPSVVWSPDLPCFINLPIHFPSIYRVLLCNKGYSISGLLTCPFSRSVRTSLFAAEMLSLDMLLKYWRNSRLTVESWSAGTLASVMGDYSR